MSLKPFQTLVEIQKIDHLIGQLEQNIREEKGRNQKIAELIQDKKAQESSNSQKLEELLTLIHKLEKELQEQINIFSRASERLPTIKTEQALKATEAEIEKSQQEKERLEEDLLLQMTEQDNLEEEKKELTTFFTGIIKSQKEIADEVEKNVSSLEKQISQYDERITNLKTLLPSQLLQQFELLNKKYRFKYPISFIDENSCFQCKMSVSTSIKDQIEKTLKPANCPGCKRLLIPHQAFS